MPEIRLGSAENMQNINLGAIELQEIWLGANLVWQNNQGPVYASVVWDGNTFNVDGTFPADLDFDTVFVTESVAATHAGDRTITLVINNIQDLDNVDPLLDEDYIVGFRLQRPDGSWAYGDPDSTAFVDFGAGDNAPVADYGEPIPGQSSEYVLADDEFIAGSETDPTASISVGLRSVDNTGTATVPSTIIVDSDTQEFADDGDWILIVVDSRGGESDELTIRVDLTYEPPAGSLRNETAVTVAPDPVAANAILSTSSASPTQYSNARFPGAPTTATVNFGNTGGPLTETIADQYVWSCVNCTNPGATNGDTFTLDIPQSDAGTATPAGVTLTVLGRSWDGNDVTTRTTIGPVFLNSGPSLTAPTITTAGGGRCDTGVTVSGTWSAASTNTIGTFVSWSPSVSGTTTAITCPACDVNASSNGPAVFETRDVSGTNVDSLSSTPSITFTGARPSSGVTCAITFPVCPNASPNITVASQGVTASDCAGTINAGTFNQGFSWTAAPGYRTSFGTMSVNCNYGAGTAPTAIVGTPITSGIACPTVTPIQGAATVTCPATVNVGASGTCTVTSTVSGVAVTTPTTVMVNCTAAGAATSAGTGVITYDNTSTSGSITGSTTCVLPPATLGGSSVTLTAVPNTFVAQFTATANFASPLSDDGNIGSILRTIAVFTGTVTCTSGYTQTSTDTITVNDAGAPTTFNGMGVTSVTNNAQINLAVPQPGETCDWDWTVSAGTYNSSDSGNVAGTESGTLTFTLP